MVEFAGFIMPVSYKSIIEEHEAVRRRAGIFDVSHMGEFIIEGKGAEGFVDNLVTNDCSRLTPGRILYTVMCRDDGTVVDDLLVYRLSDSDAPRYMLVVNAANIEKDFKHVTSFPTGEAEVRNESERCALLALQGPASRDILQNCPSFAAIRDSLDDLAYYHHVSFVSESDEILVSRTGYTGELGYEILVPPERAVEFWNEIIEVGGRWGVKPAGLAARDTLRFEASFCLYGHELDDETTPLEAGLGWVVSFGKKSFCGMEALRREKEAGSKKRLLGFEVEGRNIARQGMEILLDGDVVGRVTSGSFSPTLKKSLCMAYVASEAAGADGAFAVSVRKRMVPVRKTPLPFYKSRSRG